MTQPMTTGPYSLHMQQEPLLVSCDINRKRMYASASELSGSEGVCS